MVLKLVPKTKNLCRKFGFPSTDAGNVCIYGIGTNKYSSANMDSEILQRNSSSLCRLPTGRRHHNCPFLPIPSILSLLLSAAHPSNILSISMEGCQNSCKLFYGATPPPNSRTQTTPVESHMPPQRKTVPLPMEQKI
jgi:hypothetical protein